MTMADQIEQTSMMMLLVDDEHRPGERCPLTYLGRAVVGTEHEMAQAREWMAPLRPEVVPWDGCSQIGFMGWLYLESEKLEKERWAEVEEWEREEESRRRKKGLKWW